MASALITDVQAAPSRRAGGRSSTSTPSRPSSSAELKPLSTKIRVTGVSVSRENAVQSGSSSTTNCGEFLGTHAGNTVSFSAVNEGGTGKTKNTFIYRFGEGFEQGISGFDQVSVADNDVRIKLPELRNKVPFVQQTVYLIAEDKNGNTATDSIVFEVSRPVKLIRSNTERADALGCFERYSAEKSAFGLISNGSTNTSTIKIEHDIQKIQEKRKGRYWGIHFSPLSFAGIGDIISFNRGYFSEYTRQRHERVNVITEYNLDPGDYMEVYVQATRYIEPYDAVLVGACGKEKKIDEAFMLQWWGYSYHVYPVLPDDTSMTPVDAIGGLPQNTCPEEFSPSYNGSNGLDFTNIDL